MDIKNRFTITFFFLLCFSSIKALSQDTTSYAYSPDSLSFTLVKYTVQNLQEKAYIITDKPYYSLGDTIWFKAILVNALNHGPKTLSNTLYVDILNESGDVLQSKMLLIQNGVAAGDFIIDEKSREATYRIRAYTKWMQNFHEDFLFEKEIDVYEIFPKELSLQAETLEYSQLPKEENRLANLPSVQISLLPEGGQLVKGFPSIVGVKAEEVKAGKGVNIKGDLISKEDGSKISVSTNDDGFGACIIPNPQSDYYFELDSPVHYYEANNLKVNPHEIGMSLINRLNAQMLRLTIFTDDPGELNGGFLIAHSRGEVFLLYPIENISGQRKIMNIPKSRLPTGVSHFTFFDKKGRPRAERITFVNHGDVVTKPMIKTKEKFGKRASVEVKLELEELVEGSVSVSVTNDEVIRRDSIAGNLASYLYLESDLGSIEKAGKYFRTNDPVVWRDLDYIMLTHGWRRFTWKDVITQSDAQKEIIPEKGITIKGSIKDFTFRKRSETGVVELLAYWKEEKQKVVGMASHRYVETDENGHFMFNELYFGDSTRFELKSKKTLKSDKLKNYIALDEVAPPEAGSIIKKPKVIPVIEQYVKKSKDEKVIEINYGDDVIMLDAIEIVTERIDPYDEAVAGIYAKPDKRIIPDSIGADGNIIDLLQQTAFVQVSYNEIGNPILSIRGESIDFYLNGFQIDQEQAFDVVSFTSLTDVFFIDIDRTGINSFTNRPSVYIYTKSGNGISPDDEEIKGFLAIYKPGYYMQRAFHVPDYDGDAPIIKPDYRLQLYWNPDVKIENGVGSFRFFTGDDRTKYNIHIEGITPKGEVILGDKVIEVK